MCGRKNKNTAKYDVPSGYGVGVSEKYIKQSIRKTTNIRTLPLFVHLSKKPYYFILFNEFPFKRVACPYHLFYFFF